MSTSSRLIAIAAVQERTTLSRSSILRLVNLGSFPKPIRISPNRVSWLESSVDAWIAKRIAQ